MLTVSEVYSSKGIQGKNLKTGTAEKVKPVLFTSLTVSNKVPSKTEFLSENTRAILYNVTKNTGIAPYTPSLLKDDNTAIQHAQMHLIDLLKYYEGDRYHYYEAKAKEKLREGSKTIIFIDEIHRFSKTQQDALLPYIETGLFYFIGSTTENPSFHTVPALISRAQVIMLNKISKGFCAYLQIVDRGNICLAVR